MSKFSYKFSNLCGAVYKQGNVVFTEDGNCVLSPVGNRISLFDLKNNISRTFPFENRKSIVHFAVSPNGLLMISVDEEGRSLLINLQQNVVLHHFNFKQPVYDLQFSPNGRYFAVTHGRRVQVWHAPGHTPNFAPLALCRSFPGQYDETTCIDWSQDSNFFAVGSRDTSCRVYCLHSLPEFRYVTLVAHRSCLVACFFEKDSLNLYTVAKDGALVIWACSSSLQEMQDHIAMARRSLDVTGSSANGGGEGGETEEPEGDEEPVALENELEVDAEDRAKDKRSSKKRRRLANLCYWTNRIKHLFPKDHSRVSCVTLHKHTQLLIVGFITGTFSLYEMPDFTLVHCLSICNQRISSVAVNTTGEWLAFGCSSLGQLLVWEWQSESYILKQQGHFYDMNCLSYSPDGQIIATGGDDGKVKLWNTTSGFCFVTFPDHSAGVTGVCFNASGKVVVSCSLDGTVRAFDLHRYRNFRTFASPRPVQFSTVGLDPSGEVVCAGSQDTFEIFVWSMQTGRLLELLAAHEGPISATSFSHSQAVLASSSWDKTVRLWDIFEHKGNTEKLIHTSDVISHSFRLDGKELAVATLDGQISFWDVLNAVQTGSIDGRHDLQVGRRAADRITAQKMAGNTCFSSLCYSADGRCLLAGGRSKFVCIYSVCHQILLKKFQVSHNLAYDGMLQFLNSSHMTEAGPLDLLSGDEGEDSDGGPDIKLPGVTKGDMSSRRTRPEIRVKCLQFSPTGRAWAAVSTEGLLIYSLDSGVTFDPFDLSADITPEGVESSLINEQYSTALMMSFKLNEKELLVRSLEAVPIDDIALVVQDLPDVYVQKMLPFLAERLDNSSHLQFYLRWCTVLLTLHGTKMKQTASSLMASIRDLQKSIVQKQAELGKICDGNKYLLQYIISTQNVLAT